jgi:hypothetical protein
MNNEKETGNAPSFIAFCRQWMAEREWLEFVPDQETTNDNQHRQKRMWNPAHDRPALCTK